MELIHAMEEHNYSDGETIVEQDNPGDILFIVKTGLVDVYKDGKLIRTISKNDYFGERSILFNSFRTASAKASGEVTLWALKQSDFLSIVDSSIQN
jgi:CRP-like cAMP-binding protein